MEFVCCNMIHCLKCKQLISSSSCLCTIIIQSFLSLWLSAVMYTENSSKVVLETFFMLSCSVNLLLFFPPTATRTHPGKTRKFRIDKVPLAQYFFYSLPSVGRNDRSMMVVVSLATIAHRLSTKLSHVRPHETHKPPALANKSNKNQ